MDIVMVVFLLTMVTMAFGFMYFTYKLMESESKKSRENIERIKNGTDS